MTFHAIIQYIIYRWKAKSRHGIHSPFVYHLIEQCLQGQPQHTLLEKLSGYFGKEQLIHFGNNPQSWQPDFMKNEEQLQAARILVIPFPHKTTAHTQEWNKISDKETVSLSIDLYEYGLLISPRGYKEKQHFVLRHPL